MPRLAHIAFGFAAQLAALLAIKPYCRLMVAADAWLHTAAPLAVAVRQALGVPA